MKTNIEMASQCGLLDGLSVVPSQVERFAALVRADEREACARICEEGQKHSYTCGLLIRARGEHMNEELPLPDPAFSGWDYGSLPAVQRDGYTADQMREYAKEALAESEDDALIIQYHEATIKRLEKLLAQPEQDDRRLQIALRMWEDWKTYALELQKKLVKYEGGSPMILNTQPKERNFCPRCGKRLASGFVEISIHTCTPPHDKT